MQSEILPFIRPLKVDVPTAVKQTHISIEPAGNGEAKGLYDALLLRKVSEESIVDARNYLTHELHKAEVLKPALPHDFKELDAWFQDHSKKVSLEYQAYLQSRKNGSPRRYFSSKAHALNFIKRVAPTKLVDGAWLYGLTRHWNDFRYGALIRIYLEELGSGIPARNHVLIYKKLLAEYGCEDQSLLSDDHFTQGAIQLSLAYNAEAFLPELIGFNLGYEQLPLHLLITAYELNELGIDPYYFTLHVTIDNQATGHARKSIDAVLNHVPVLGDEDEYFHRVMNGYKLNLLGASTTSIIDSFDLYEELLGIFKEKSRFGKNMHSDYCRLDGRTVNDWLSDEAQLPAFIQALENKGWIKRHDNSQESRFWKLIDGDSAEMFGVFSCYEKQVIYEWIAGNWKPGKDHQAISSLTTLHESHHLSYRTKQRLLSPLDLEFTSPSVAACLADNDLGAETARELKLLEDKIQAMDDLHEIFSSLSEFISPALQHTSIGLMATRLYSSLFKSQP